MDVNYSYYTSAKGFRIVGGTAAQFLKADGSIDSQTYFPTNNANSASSTTYQGSMLAMPVGTYSAGVSAASTNMPYNQPGGLISFGQTGNTVSGRILSPRDNTDNWFVQSGAGTGSWLQLASRSYVGSMFVPYTGANQPVNIGSQNLTTTGVLYGYEFQGRIWSSPVLTGSQVVNASNANVLVLGNGNLPNFYYSSQSNHTFIVNGTTRMVVTGSGISVVGTLAVNGEGVVTQSSLNSQLGAYATLAGVQTFTNTITFAQSPVIPNATLNNHAVNLAQLNTRALALGNAAAIGFSGGNVPTSDGGQYPYFIHETAGFIPMASQSYVQYMAISKADKTTEISAGTGLVGGGNLSVSRSISLSTDTQLDIEKGIAAFNYGDHAQQGYLKNGNGFLTDSFYREIDSSIDLDDTSIKEYHIVFDSSTDAKVTILSMTDGQMFRISNFSVGNAVELWVNGYPVALDTIGAGDTKVYLSHHSGKLRRLSANPTGPII